MSVQEPTQQTSPAEVAVKALADELRTVRAERDHYRDRWLAQVDINDKMRARLAADAAATERLEAMCRE